MGFRPRCPSSLYFFCTTLPAALVVPLCPLLSQNLGLRPSLVLISLLCFAGCVVARQRIDFICGIFLLRVLPFYNSCDPVSVRVLTLFKNFSMLVPSRQAF